MENYLVEEKNAGPTHITGGAHGHTDILESREMDLFH